MPGGKIAILHTRWHQRDLIGRLIKDATLNPDADQYEVFEFPAILTYANPDYDPEVQDSASELQKSLWPEQWSLEHLLRTKASMPAWQWNAQYQQQPTAQEAAIIKRDQIKWWPKEDPPEVDYTVQAWDTALTTNERSDYSVCQTWGVWQNEDGVDNVILLNRIKGKYEFPELKRTALQQVKEWTPDTTIVEAKASGQPLIDEMRRSGIFVQDYTPGKGQDKIARVNAISDMFTSGQVWFPETWWASEVVDELLAFPNGEHDDDVDACTLALIRIRKGGLLKLQTDHEEPDLMPRSRRGAYY
jgi:predicted phage terminase large subunit-like protein